MNNESLKKSCSPLVEGMSLTGERLPDPEPVNLPDDVIQDLKNHWNKQEPITPKEFIEYIARKNREKFNSLMYPEDYSRYSKYLLMHFETIFESLSISHPKAYERILYLFTDKESA